MGAASIAITAETGPGASSESNAQEKSDLSLATELLSCSRISLYFHANKDMDALLWFNNVCFQEGAGRGCGQKVENKEKKKVLP